MEFVDLMNVNVLILNPIGFELINFLNQFILILVLTLTLINYNYAFSYIYNNANINK